MELNNNVAYDFSSSLNPSKDFSFNPSNPSNISNITSPIGVNDNPYVPTCDDKDRYEKEIYKNQVVEYTNLYGQRIDYYSNGFKIEKQTPLYGENPLARYRGPRRLKAIVDFSTYTTFIQQYGIMTDLEITIYIPIPIFQQTWGKEVIPLRGDLFVVIDSACDRPAGQDPIVFEVTDKHDSINPVDFLGGHYYWKITAKRYDNSYEPGAPQEKYLGGPVDDGDYGKIESEENETIVVKSPIPKEQEATQQAKQDFDNPNDRKKVYGYANNDENESKTHGVYY